MRQNSLCLLVVVCVVTASDGSFAQEQPSAPRVVLNQPTHFVAPDGTALALAPGMYDVEAASGPALRLSGQGDASALLLKATSIPHQESLAEVTAVLILTGEDTVHLVLLHPDGTALDAVGSLTGVQSRAPAPVGPGISTTPLTQNQIQQGLMAGETVRMAGVPPAPLLTTPVVGHSVAAWGEQFSWQPGTGTPAPTSYQLCIAEAGKPCARVGQPSTTSVVIANLPPSTRTYRVTGPMLQPLLTYGQQKNLTWTVGACAPSQVLGAAGGTISGGAAQLACQYARPLSLTWKHVLSAPVPSSPEPGALVNDRPQLSIQGPVEGAHHYLFCVSWDWNCSTPMSLGYNPYTFIVNTGSGTSTYGWEWHHDKDRPNLEDVGPPGRVVGLPTEDLAGKGGNWATAACLDEQHCTWSPSISVRMLPFSLISSRLHNVRFEPPYRQEFEWQDQAHPLVTHYRLCLATMGTTPTKHGFPLVRLPGILRELCSGEILPGQQPTYLKDVPATLLPYCPTGGCRMPRPVATYYTTQARFILDLHDHPELAVFGGQPLVWTIAACSSSNRNCLWITDLLYDYSGVVTFPPNSQEPSPVFFGESGSSLSWYPWWGNDFYLPCLREVNATCETGNLLIQPPLNAVSRVGSPQDHPPSCSLSGPPLTGSKVIQVAGCSNVWGCRWSDAQQFNFPQPVPLPRSQDVFMCRQP